jgi:hypothetical protein
MPLIKAAGPPNAKPSIENCTLPVGVPPGLVTVAVKVTDCPNADGFKLDMTVVVVVALFTVWFTLLDVLLLKSPSLLTYEAVMGWAPTESEVLVSVAVPCAFTGRGEPTGEPLSRN